MATKARPVAETGKTISLGALGPLKVAAVPVFIGIWAAMGPGVIWGAMAQGSGELIWWPYLTAKYGAAFLGILLPACILQYFVNQEIIRYTATTGETFFTGMSRINKFLAGFMWIMLAVTFLWFGGYASGGATAIRELVGWPVDPRGGTLFWAYLTIAIFLGAIVFGRVIYKIIEKVMAAVVAVTVVGLIVAVLNPKVLSTAGAFFAAYLNPVRIFTQGLPANFEPADYNTLLTSIAFAGAGGFFNVMYSYWIRDKGHGMSRYIGRVTSPITGEKETIPETGYAFEDTPDNRSNYKNWINYLRLDNLIGVGVNLITVMMMAWLAWAILMPTGEVPSGWNLAVVQSAFFGETIGAIGRAIFLIVAAAFLCDSWLTITDAVSRMHSDFFFSNFAWARRFTFRTWYYIFVAILTVISCVTMLLAQPGLLLILGGVLNFFAMAVYIPFLIYLNYFMVPKKFPSWTRPANITLAIICIVSAIYLILGVWYLTVIL
jgi:Mn2+/Fe2+ NRAMP family transporter